MAGGPTDPDDGTDDKTDSQIRRRQIDPHPDAAYLDVLEFVADIHDCDVEDLSPLYDCVDELVGHLFRDPPPAEAEVELEFTYSDLRIHLDQRGQLAVWKHDETLGSDE